MAGGRQIEFRNELGCRILVVFKGAGFDFSYVPSFAGRPGPPPAVLLFAGIKMHLSIRDDSNISPTLQKLHHFLAAPRHRRPTRFRLRILFRSPQVSSVEFKIHLSEFSLRRHSNRKALVFEQYRLPALDKRLLVDSQKRAFEGERHNRILPRARSLPAGARPFKKPNGNATQVVLMG
jgi:hypothetical protein